MKALTIQQPYAQLVARKLKPIENRTWETKYRGALAIHAGKGRDHMTSPFVATFRESELPFGVIVAAAVLVDCVQLRDLPARLRSNAHAIGPYCWLIGDSIELLRPIPCRGGLGLWNLGPAILEEIHAQLAELRKVDHAKA